MARYSLTTDWFWYSQRMYPLLKGDYLAERGLPCRKGGSLL